MIGENWGVCFDPSGANLVDTFPLGNLQWFALKLSVRFLLIWHEAPPLTVWTRWRMWISSFTSPSFTTERMRFQSQVSGYADLPSTAVWTRLLRWLMRNAGVSLSWAHNLSRKTCLCCLPLSSIYHAVEAKTKNLYLAGTLVLQMKYIYARIQVDPMSSRIVKKINWIVERVHNYY